MLTTTFTKKTEIDYTQFEPKKYNTKLDEVIVEKKYHTTNLDILTEYSIQENISDISNVKTLESEYVEVGSKKIDEFCKKSSNIVQNKCSNTNIRNIVDPPDTRSDLLHRNRNLQNSQKTQTKYSERF